MTDSRVPQITGQAQPHIVTPLDGFPSCLVDDPVYLVDSSLVLVGSAITPIGDIKLATSNNAPKQTGDTLQLKTSTQSNAPPTTIRIRR
jgi:hypothetical protein